jgi:hypothetical protein
MHELIQSLDLGFILLLLDCWPSTSHTLQKRCSIDSGPAEKIPVGGGTLFFFCLFWSARSETYSQQKLYENNKQYKQALRKLNEILEKAPNHGGTCIPS